MATGAHLYYPLDLYYPSVMSHLEVASSRYQGNSGWLLTAPWGHSAGPQSKKVTAQLQGTLEEKVEMEITTLMGNTRKTLISNQLAN